MLTGSEEVRTTADGSTGANRRPLAMNCTTRGASRISCLAMLASRRLHTKVARLLSVAVLATCCALCLMASQASARSVFKPPPVVRGATYLALGDSVTFGYMEPNVVPAPNYSNASSFVGYPQIVGRLLRLKAVNAACPGETSSSFINTSAQSNGCENSFGGGPAYRPQFPLHVHYSGSQLAFAVSYLKRNRKVRLVSLMIGANDVFLCQKTTSDGCLSASDQQTVFGTISRNVRTILSAIRNKARYRGQIVIVNYYSLDYSSSLFNNVSLGINNAVDSSAKAFRVQFADGYGQFQAATSIFGGSTCTAGLITKLSTGSCGVHPTRAGQGLLAQAVVYALRF